MKTIDLHLHSTYTDGTYSPIELVQKAKDIGLSAIAITDHDNLVGYAEAKLEADRIGIEILPGIEMSTIYQGRKLHILGLGMDLENPEFQERYKEIRAPKVECLDTILKRLQARGVDISREKITPYANNQFDRYAVMRFFAAHKTQEDVQYIWDDYLNPATEGLEINTATPIAIETIRRAVGVASLAHYHKGIGLKGLSTAEMEAWLQELKGMGLNGLEAMYSNFSPEEEAMAQEWVKKFDFIPTGGTDFHGDNRPTYKMGVGNGSLKIPYAWYEGIGRACRQ